MPLDALPDDLRPDKNPDAWKGTDNDTWYARWTFWFLGWQAYGPLSKTWWGNWKFPPKVLVKIGGDGWWRYETFMGRDGVEYRNVLSRCQYFKRWALVLEWPLSLRFHIYWRAKDVPDGNKPWVNEFDISRLLFFYGPIHWDTTPVYWLLSFYLGGQWK